MYVCVWCCYRYIYTHYYHYHHCHYYSYHHNYCSQATITNTLIFVSGCIALDPTLPPPQTLVTGGIEIQTIRALENLKNIILDSGGSLNNVCKTTILLRDILDYKIVNEIYQDWWSSNGVPNTHTPARAAFSVAGIPANALIEIDAIVAV